MSKSSLVLASTRRFFDDPDNARELDNIMRKRDGISLRTLEWFITSYAKTSDLTYETSAGDRFAVHVSYKSTLDGYSKTLFDPFCRTNRIEFNGFRTTVAQLNFLKWCISHDIIKYIRDNGIKRTPA